MKIRIIKNDPSGIEGCSDISKYIGRVFNVRNNLVRLSKNIYVNLAESESRYDELLIFKGEYEIVEE